MPEAALTSFSTCDAYRHSCTRKKCATLRCRRRHTVRMNRFLGAI